MGKIVAIGSGKLGQSKRLADGSVIEQPVEILEITREVVRLSGKDAPHLVFLATASGDDELYIEGVLRHFAGLGCEVSALKLVSESPTDEEVRSAILGADIIYVGGGLTLKMLEVWRTRGVDNLLREAFGNGVVLSGSAAGAMCWFEFGITNLSEFVGDSNMELAPVQCLGLIQGLCTPHASKEPARVDFIRDRIKHEFISSDGYAIDDCAALIFEDGNVRSMVSAIGAERSAGVRKIALENNEIVETKI
ncbi:MAG: Type 1 glutamine amidotransferase-like domain-containing protein [Alphaproteobacteria bacterium]|nr:Type 1 glutamine amidotransferase-like domain-containing protein [Alphaproteobacteria bacterium]